MSGEIYLGYSPADLPYVRALAAQLKDRGIPTWFDPDVTYGEQWDAVLQYKIEHCAAFVPVLTPQSVRFEPLRRQAAYAREQRRPTVSLALQVKVATTAGEETVSVESGTMPPESFFARLRDLVRRAIKPVRPRPTGYAFISYSRQDKAYVQRLAGHLEAQGAKIWYDTDLTVGRSFPRQLEERLGGCAALIPVMSVASRASDWVVREILCAQDYDRPILPLLLSGKAFFVLRDLHYEDVSGGAMPSAAFVSRVLGQTRRP